MIRATTLFILICAVTAALYANSYHDTYALERERVKTSALVGHCAMGLKYSTRVLVEVQESYGNYNVALVANSIASMAALAVSTRNTSRAYERTMKKATLQYNGPTYRKGYLAGGIITRSLGYIAGTLWGLPYTLSYSTRDAREFKLRNASIALIACSDLLFTMQSIHNQRVMNASHGTYIKKRPAVALSLAPQLLPQGGGLAVRLRF